MGLLYRITFQQPRVARSARGRSDGAPSSDSLNIVIRRGCQFAFKYWTGSVSDVRENRTTGYMNPPQNLGKHYLDATVEDVRDGKPAANYYYLPDFERIWRQRFPTNGSAILYWTLSYLLLLERNNFQVRKRKRQ